MGCKNSEEYHNSVDSFLIVSCVSAPVNLAGSASVYNRLEVETCLEHAGVWVHVEERIVGVAVTVLIDTDRARDTWTNNKKTSFHRVITENSKSHLGHLLLGRTHSASWEKHGGIFYRRRCVLD